MSSSSVNAFYKTLHLINPMVKNGFEDKMKQYKLAQKDTTFLPSTTTLFGPSMLELLLYMLLGPLC